MMANRDVEVSELPIVESGNVILLIVENGILSVETFPQNKEGNEKANENR